MVVLLMFIFVVLVEKRFSFKTKHQASLNPPGSLIDK